MIFNYLLNSIGGHYMPSIALPLSVYAASKFAVTSLTEIVRKELAEDPNNKIKITVRSVYTNLQKRFHRQA